MRVTVRGFVVGTLIVLQSACAGTRAPGADHGVAGAVANAGMAQQTCGGAGVGGAVAAGASGQADADGGGVPASAGKLCDGSDAMRAMFSVGTGFAPIQSQFTSPRGDFWVIDGHCRFYVSFEGAVGSVTGVLDDVDAAQLSADIAWQQLDAWAGVTSHPQCSDGGIRRLGNDHGASACICLCGDDAPKALVTAYDNAYKWFKRLVGKGTRVSGSMSVIALPNTSPADRMFVDWPLSRGMKLIPNLIVDPNTAAISSGPFARFDVVADVAALRAMQDADLDLQHNPASAEHVQDGGENYDVFTRDELPDEVEHAIDVLLQHWPSF